jgi:uncharacterized protein YndB with AHSA1/START domain
MSQTSPQARSVVVERELPHPPEKVWRALTQPHLIEAWLMKNDFAPVAGHRFDLTPNWGAVRCRVLEVRPYTALSYTWAAMGLETVVAWTLTPMGAGTHLRMEQSGFGPDQEQAFRGATQGWRRFLDRLDQVLASRD